MNHLGYVFVLFTVLLSCKKDEKTGPLYTSDVPGNYTTSIAITYNQQENVTSVRGHCATEVDDNSSGSLKLPSGSYMKYNGIQLTGDYFVETTVVGKDDALVEFLDYDQTLYTNSIVTPDTVYFINLPDTVDASQDLLIGFGPPLAGNEHWVIYLTGYSDYDEYYDETTDSTLFISKTTLQSNSQKSISLTRVTKLENPDLPDGGGTVTYMYRTDKTIYFE